MEGKLNFLMVFLMSVEYCSSNALPHHYNPHAETHRGRSPSFGSRGRDFGGPRGGGAGDRRKRSVSNVPSTTLLVFGVRSRVYPIALCMNQYLCGKVFVLLFFTASLPYF